MKKVLALLLCAALLPLSGCAGSIYSDYREIEQLQLVQTLGFDAEKEGVRLSASTGRPPEGEEPWRMAVSAPSLTLAMELAQDYSPREEMYFAHTTYILLGEKAGEDMGRYLDFVARSVPLRLETPLFIARGCTAEELVMKAGGDKNDVTEVLASLERDSLRRGGPHIFSCAEVSRSLAEYGAALCCAVMPAETGPVTGQEGITALRSGFAVLREGALAGWVEEDAIRGAGLMLGEAGAGSVELPSGVTVELSGGGAKLEPVWDEGGGLSALEVRVSIKGSVLEMHAPADASGDEVLERLRRELSAEARRWVTETLAVSKATEADFLGLGRSVERMAPGKWAAVAGEWPELLGELPITVTAEAELLRAYDIEAPARVDGRS